MKEEVIKVEERYLIPAKEIVRLTLENIRTMKKFVLTVGGESGSGKSTLAHAIRGELARQDIKSSVFHMDDYFKLPPFSNHERREKDINHVGMSEVNIALLQDHIASFLSDIKALEKPLVHYKANSILSEEMYLADTRVLIVEGTYVTILKNVNCKVFLMRNYKETFENRKQRNRDKIIPFNEEVLAIEHQIIAPHQSLADILVDRNRIVQDKRPANI